MSKSKKLIRFRKKSSIRLECEIDLDQLFEAEKERGRFEQQWNEFLRSNSYNPKIYSKKKNHLSYTSEQLIPRKKDNRPPMLLVFGNPASQSIINGMFFSFNKEGKEHRFWKDILKSAGSLSLNFKKDLPYTELNRIRRSQILNLKYVSPYRIGLSVLITMPSAPGGKWGGVAGVQKLIGVKALRKLEREESLRIVNLAEKFVDSDGYVVIFQKNAWDGLRSEDDPRYAIGFAKTGQLKGKLKSTNIPLLGVPPTRLVGPCRSIIKQIAQ